MKTTLKGICILFVGLMVLAVFSRIGDALKAPAQPAAKQGTAATDATDALLDKMKMSACLVAVDAVMARLNVPSMANIPACGWNYEKFYVRISKDRHTAVVRGQVHAQNSSGVALRGNWVATLEYNGERGWTAVQLTMIE